MTRVLPDPAPASTSTGPSIFRTAFLCCGLRSERSSAMRVRLATPPCRSEPVLILRRKHAWSAFPHAQATVAPAAVSRMLAPASGRLLGVRAADPFIQGGPASGDRFQGRRAGPRLPGHEPESG